MPWMRNGFLLLVVCLGLIPAGAQDRPAITGVAFVRFYESHVQAADEFYRMLGFAPDTSNAALTQYEVNPSQWVETLRFPASGAQSRMAAVGFTTSDAALLQQYLRRHQVQVVQPLAGGQFTVLDPEGNRVVFVQAGSHRFTPVQGFHPLAASSHRILHVGFMVHSADAEDRFYRGLLGFRPYWHGGMTDTRTEFVSLQVPDGSDWLEYMLDDNLPANPEDRQRELGGMNHFSLGVAHMQSAEDALASNGCAQTAQARHCVSPQMGRDGKIQMNVFDPDLTRIEYMEFHPSGPVCCSAFSAPHPNPADR